jgi:NAD(P)-dependent dehydrogenase (short-subunit alcohol dehydrogenase family)
MTTQTTPKIAIVTGGSRGLGRSTVLSLAKRGVDSIFTYRSNRAAAEKVIGLVRESGRTATALPESSSTTAFASLIAATIASAYSVPGRTSRGATQHDSP